jgi:PhnB protein
LEKAVLVRQKRGSGPLLHCPATFPPPSYHATGYTSIAPRLSVRNGAKAIDFYEIAFGAAEVFRLDAEDGFVVAGSRLAQPNFGSRTNPPVHGNFSPESRDGSAVRMVMVAEDPDATFSQAVVGIRCQANVRRTWLAPRPNRPFLRPLLENW